MVPSPACASSQTRKAGPPAQFYDTEYHAYQSESYVDMGLGKANETDANPAWAPGITTQQRTTNITRDAYSNACFDVYGGSCP